MTTKTITRHGTSAGYAAGCRRPCCTKAAVRDDQLRVLDRLQGRPRTVSAIPVRAHLAELRRAGMTWEEIARAAGTAPSTPREIHDQRKKGMWRSTAEKLLAVPVTHQATVGHTNATGATRRLRALYALGHSRETIAAATELSLYTITLIVAGHWEQITLANDQAVRRVYDALSMKHGRSHKNVIRARREGWAPPLAWDDDEIDNPKATPNTAPEPPLMAVADERAALREDARVLTVRGYSADEIAERLGVTSRTIVRWRTANGWKAAA